MTDSSGGLARAVSASQASEVHVSTALELAHAVIAALLLDDDYTPPEGGRKASVPSSGPPKKDKGSSGLGDIEPQPES